MDHSKIIISVLEHHDIEYWTFGKNVSVDSINIRCPFCEDQSNHCGIFKDTLGYHCWRCDRTGTFDFLIAYLTRRPVEECTEEIASFGINFSEDAVEQIYSLLNPVQEEIEEEENEICTLPPFFDLVTFDTQFPLLSRYEAGYVGDKYIPHRALDRQVLIDHGCGICTCGPEMNRLVIPVYFQDELVSYQAADLTGRSDVKYRTYKNQINQFLYRWDMIDLSLGYLILVEGVRDAWRLGGNAVATFGTSLTARQRQLVIGSHVFCVILCWDGDSFIHAKAELEELSPNVDTIIQVQLPYEQDPDSYGYENTWAAINEILQDALS